MVKPLNLNFSVFTVKLVGVRKFRNFTVIYRSRCVTISTIWALHSAKTQSLDIWRV